eukprot:1721610-Prymnesium_polylepis.1
MASNKRTHPSGAGGASAARGAPPIHLWDGRDHPAGAAAVAEVSRPVAAGLSMCSEGKMHLR